MWRIYGRGFDSRRLHQFGVKKEYEVISVKEWFALFFIPILPTENNEGSEEFVECRTCKKTYDTDVLVKLTDNR